MPDGTTKVEPRGAAPYTAFQSVKTLLKGFKDNGVPGRIDRSVMRNFSNAVGSQILTAIKFLGLIDEEGHPTEPLRELVRVIDTTEWKPALESTLKTAYRPLFALDLQTASPAQFNDKFRASYAGTDEVLRKSITFFLNAARDTDIKISAYIMANKKPRTATVKRRNVGSNGNAGQQSERRSQQQPAADTTPESGSKFKTAAEVLFDLLDVGNMEEEEQQAVWTLIKYIKSKGQ